MAEKVGKLLGYLIGISLVLGLPVILVLYIFDPTLIATDFSSSPRFNLNTPSITLNGTPGKNVDFFLTGSSISGNWASRNGLKLELSDNSRRFDRTFAVLAPQPDTWGKSICTNCGASDTFAIHVKFTLPSSLASPGVRTLAGYLTGDVYTPVGTGSIQNGQATFKNVSMRLDIPITLKLKS